MGFLYTDLHLWIVCQRPARAQVKPGRVGSYEYYSRSPMDSARTNYYIEPGKNNATQMNTSINNTRVSYVITNFQNLSFPAV